MGALGENLGDTYLLVGKHQEDSIPELILSQHPHELLTGLIHTLSVIAVHHEDQACNAATSLHMLNTPHPTNLQATDPILRVAARPPGPGLALLAMML
jgi:hypothetical protein